jgi:hypothetical protein
MKDFCAQNSLAVLADPGGRANRGLFQAIDSGEHHPVPVVLTLENVL